MDGCDDDRVPIVDAEDNNDGANERDHSPGLSYRKERLGISGFLFFVQQFLAGNLQKDTIARMEMCSHLKE